MKDLAPSHGVCETCWNHVGRSNLHHDHCHACGEWRGWLCMSCNTTLQHRSEGIWDSLGRYLDSHQCMPALFDPGPPQRRSCAENPYTDRVYIGHGGDDRYIMCAKPGSDWVTVEQAAAIMGVAAGTARDGITGRHRSPRGFRLDNGTWAIHHGPMVRWLHERWQV